MTPKARRRLDQIARYAGYYAPEKLQRLLNEFLRQYPSATAAEVAAVMAQHGVIVQVRPKQAT